MQTRQQLIDAVARVLGLLPLGQTLSAEDYADLDAQIDPAIAELLRRNVYRASNTQSFPDEIVPALADCIAVVCASQNEVSQLRGTPVETFRTLAEDRLRVITAPPRTFRTLRIDPALTQSSRDRWGHY
jgi:hypothetical protein